MQTPQAPEDEIARLRTLHDLQILDTAPEERFEQITRFVQSFFSVRIALISLVDKDRQWFKSKQGLGTCETDRSISFCGHSILSDEVFVVEDALQDERFADNPLVSGDPKIRFYAGYPLKAANGKRLGTLCIIDTASRKFDSEARRHLRDIGSIVEAKIQQRSDELKLKVQTSVGLKASVRTAFMRWSMGYGSIIGRRNVALAFAFCTFASFILLAFYMEKDQTALHPGSEMSRSILHFLVFGIVGALMSSLMYLLMRLPENLRHNLQVSHTAKLRSETRFRDAIEALDDGFVIFDAERRLTLFNDKFFDLYRPLAPALKLGNSYSAIREYARAEGFVKPPAAGENDALPARVGTRDVELADGRWHRIVERPMQDGGTVGFHSDITDLKNTEQELRAAKLLAEAANRTKTQFFANVSHEVRTPLNGILGLMDVILDDTNLGDQQRLYMTTVQESAVLLLGILNDILDASKMEAGMLSLKLAPFDVHSMLRSACQLMEQTAETKGLALKLELTLAEQCRLLGDAGRIRQILLNLISNAVKFTEAGAITLRATCQSVRNNNQLNLQLEVIDTGIGIEPSEIGNLLKPFTQVENASNKRHSGTGLGLAICNHLVKLMGGKLQFNSQPGQGSHATVILPLDICELKAKDNLMETPMKEVVPRQLRILLADDGATNQLVIRAILEDTPYLLDIALDGDEAVKAVSSTAYDLVLMDIYMPKMDGLTATRHIRQTQPNIPIVAITANAMDGDRSRFLAEGMNDYISKPVNKARLISCIQRLTADRHLN